MIGKTIGPFEVVEQIAKGSLGILYRAFDKRMRREVALRLFDEDITSHQEAAMQFAFVESYARGGHKVKLPLAEHGGYILHRDGLLDPARTDLPGSRAPKFKRETAV